MILITFQKNFLEFSKLRVFTSLKFWIFFVAQLYHSKILSLPNFLSYPNSDLYVTLILVCKLPQPNYGSFPNLNLLITLTLKCILTSIFSAWTTYFKGDPYILIFTMKSVQFFYYLSLKNDLDFFNDFWFPKIFDFFTKIGLVVQYWTWTAFKLQ